MKSALDVTVMLPKGYINDLGAERLEQTSEDARERTEETCCQFFGCQFINTIGVSILRASFTRPGI
jgi:hypothetical protein